MNWNDRDTTKKGNIGEEILMNYLLRHDYIPYLPNYSGAHPFDILCASKDKKRIFIADSKAKPARVYYPDTGINYSHYEQYKYIQDKHNLHVFIYFIDEDNGKIYGEFLNNLDKERTVIHKGKSKEYPSKEQDKYGTWIIYFPLEAMKIIDDIPEDKLKLLKKYSTRNEIYKKNY